MCSLSSSSIDDLAQRLQAASGATITIRGLDDLGEVGQGTAGDDGYFQIEGLPPGRPIFSILSREGDVPTSYSGFTGVYDFTVPEGRAALMPLTDLDTRLAGWREAAPEVVGDWAPDPSSDGTGGILIGAAFEFIDGLPTLPPMPDARIELYDEEGTLYEAHYSGPGPDGEIPDPTAEATYVDGRFWVFGLAEGLYEGRAIFSLQGRTEVCPFWAWVPEDGVALLQSLQLGAC